VLVAVAAAWHVAEVDDVDRSVLVDVAAGGMESPAVAETSLVVTAVDEDQALSCAVDVHAPVSNGPAE
jgi:hypothetical protein